MITDWFQESSLQTALQRWKDQKMIAGMTDSSYKNIKTGGWDKLNPIRWSEQRQTQSTSTANTEEKSQLNSNDWDKGFKDLTDGKLRIRCVEVSGNK